MMSENVFEGAVEAVLGAKDAFTVNPAFFREIKEDNLELRQILRRIDTLLADSRMRWPPERLVALVSRLRDHLARYFLLEETYGYFRGPASVDTEITGAAELLKSEHTMLYSQILDIEEQARYIRLTSPSTSLKQQVMGRLREFVDRLRDHEHSELDLLQRALCCTVLAGS